MIAAHALDRFTLQLLRLGSGRALLLCHFRHDLLPAFCAAVPESERTFHPRLHAWGVTAAGYHALERAERDRLAPVPPEVLNHVYPWPSG